MVYEPLPDQPLESHSELRQRKYAHEFTQVDRDWVAFFVFAWIFLIFAGCINNLIYVVILSAAVDLVGSKVPKIFPLAMLFAYFVMLSSPPAMRHSQLFGYEPLSPSRRLSTDPSLPPNQHRTPWEVSGTSSRFAPQQEALDEHNNSQNGLGDPEDNTLTPVSPSLSPGNTSDRQSVTSSPLSIVQTPWEGPSWEVPVQTIEPTSINTLLRTTDPEDPNFVSPFRDSGDALDPMGRRQRHYKMNRNEDMSFSEKLAIVRSLFWPFMVPLFLVFVAEYTMNQGVLPVVLFPLEKTPFQHMRDHYVTYAAIYQVGVFISRSSASYIQISRVWIPSFLQVCTLLFTISQALVGFIPWIYIIFALVFWEGLLGGSTYVHTYICISRDLEHDPKAKEFALGAVGVADGLGITMAGLVSLYLEPALCRYQVVERGIELCLSMAD
ncbi:battenin CLN3 protein [Podila epicladia]|nr:battenin CLN3 protein [Podila epicladia]